jgi:hypothetical protein
MLPGSRVKFCDAQSRAEFRLGHQYAVDGQLNAHVLSFEFIDAPYFTQVA